VGYAVGGPAHACVWDEEVDGEKWNIMTKRLMAMTLISLNNVWDVRVRILDEVRVDSKTARSSLSR
jgi:hypothetical protein